MMRRLVYFLLASLWTSGVLAAPATESMPAAAAKTRAPATGARAVDSKQVEKDLQSLPWSQFRAVIEAVPKMKADVEAYGPLGWKFVEAKYRTHAWKKNVDKLDEAQKKQLVRLIQAAKGKQ